VLGLLLRSPVVVEAVVHPYWMRRRSGQTSHDFERDDVGG
jgi:hypothetical protein